MYNRLTGGPSSASLAYDPDGRLYQTIGAGVTTRFLYDGASMIAEFNASNVLQRRYVPGAGLDESAAWYEGAGVNDRRWPVADERGSVIAVTNASGAASGAGFGLNTYDEYGQRGASNVGRFQFAGAAFLPEVGLHHMRARAYAAATGRFVQSDPILHAGGMNLYAYVGADPVNFTDPWGLVTCPEVGEDGKCQPRSDTIVVIGRLPSLAGVRAPPSAFDYAGFYSEGVQLSDVFGTRVEATEDEIVVIGGGRRECPGQAGLRTPDFYGSDVTLPFLFAGPVAGALSGGGGQGVVDRYGEVYLGGHLALGLPAGGFSVTAGWMLQDTVPSREQLSAFLSGQSRSFAAGGPPVAFGLPLGAGYVSNSYGEAIIVGVISPGASAQDQYSVNVASYADLSSCTG